jgi:hypothetical protein
MGGRQLSLTHLLEKRHNARLAHEHHLVIGRQPVLSAQPLTRRLDTSIAARAITMAQVGPP